MNQQIALADGISIRNTNETLIKEDLFVYNLGKEERCRRVKVIEI